VDRRLVEHADAARLRVAVVRFSLVDEVVDDVQTARRISAADERSIQGRIKLAITCDSNSNSTPVTGTAGVKVSLLGHDSWIAAAEEVSLQTASEGGKRR